MSSDSSEPELIHRLKNHLCIVVGYIELLLEETPEEDARYVDLVEARNAARDAIAMMPDLTRKLRS